MDIVRGPAAIGLAQTGAASRDLASAAAAIVPAAIGGNGHTALMLISQRTKVSTPSGVFAHRS